MLWFATILAVWNGANHELEELLDGHLAQAGALIAAHGGEDDDDGYYVVQVPGLQGKTKPVLWQIWRKGELVQRSTGAPAEPLAVRERGFASRELSGEAWRVFSTGALRDGSSVHIAERLSDRQDILHALTRNLLWPMLVALPLLAFAILLAVRASLAPLRRLGTLLATRGPLSLEPLPLDGAPAEVRPLVAAINALLARIERALAQEKRFTADAAHELRTPIAALRAQAQVALASTDARERGAALEAMLAASDRAARLLEQLLMLARLDAHDALSHAERADLGVLARSALAQLADSAPERNDDIELRADAPAEIRGQPVLIEVLLRNLFDNALRYTRPGEPVLVSLAASGGETQLCVEDGGAGLDATAMARLGERFFRAAPEGPPGTGLGWSISRRIAGLHGATVEVDRSPGLGGLRIRLRFPPLQPT